MFDLFLIEMNEFSQRINQIADYYGVTKASEFAKKTGFSHQTASNYLKGVRIPTAESIKTIKQVFDKIDANWLLTGKGDMICKIDCSETINEPHEQYGKSPPCHDCFLKDHKIIELQAKLIECQEQTIEIFKEIKFEK